jgi:predicted Ser/Thr protein kinase/tetratricopeptide (TPR) repeat protein
MNLDHIGKYRVVGTIGKGAMGEVYKAKDPLLNRYVAIKTIAPALAADPEFRRRFQREAQSAAQLNHTNIVTVFDFGDEDGLTYMAMELLEGRDLKDVVRARDLRLGEKLSVMDQICDGLAFAHAKGLVHRDLKPGNIHLQPNGQVKILDFGLARLGASDMTKTGTVMGTPHYMSPEQVRGQKADARSDVFSLGAVFYELLSYHRPFEADSVHGVLFQILEQEPEPIRKWAPDVPAALVGVVERALSKDPAHRYADAGEMARGLAEARDAIAGETVVGHSPGASTIFQGGDATVVEPSPAASVRGATALTLARTPNRAPTGPMARTVRPDPTVGGGPATQPPAAAGRTWPLLLGAGGVLLIAAAVGGIVWMRGRAATQAPPAATSGQEQASLTDVYVTNQVELARADLANRDFEAAARRAEDALKLKPASGEARAVLDQAREVQRQIADAVAQARGAFGRGDVGGATAALGRVMALDPRQPVIAELSAALKQHFRPQAEDGRRQAEGARKAAEESRATAIAGFTQGRQLAAEADGLFRRQDYAAAAQKYMESRNAFERATRQAGEARAAAARPAPSPHPTLAAAVTPAPLVPTAVPTAAAAPTPAPTVSPTVVFVPPPPPATAPATPSAPAVVPATPRSAEAEKAQLQRVIAEYGRALENRDLGLYRTLIPGLSPESEKRLREAFKAYKPERVGITVDSVQLEGDRATVRATRQDVIEGRATKAVSQTFQLVRSGSAWQIQSIGQ